MNKPHHTLTATQGIVLVALAALLWSFGGTIARFITVGDSWTVVLWRSGFGAVFLFLFMLVRDGIPTTIQKFRDMGWPGLSVALCFATASTCFVVALAYTTVANILLMQAGAPLIAALLAFLVFGERVSLSTWLAIVAVIIGVGIMVSQSLTGKVSLVGDGLAVVITVAFSIAIVITRRHSHIEMVPAVCLGVAIACIFSAFMATQVSVSTADAIWLLLFGAANLGLGLALFVLGTRAVPAALAALISTLEPVLAPLWVWLIHGEVPATLTLVGGGVVFAALLAHTVYALPAATQTLGDAALRK
jgi:drug/metabolite transporter (DMT)-like permease